MKNKTAHLSPSSDKLYAIFKKKYESMSKENWHKQIVNYLKEIKSFSGNSIAERMVIGWIAGLYERAYYLAAHEKPIHTQLNFNNQLMQITDSKSLPGFLGCLGKIVCGKRQPSFIESVIPTLERFRILECLPEVFGNGVDSIIVGGSMSYIPFFGIRENKKTNDFSDIDMLIVINDNFFKDSSWKKFKNSNLFPNNEKKIFLERIKVFQKLNQNNIADIFSQRFSIIGKSFTISNHFITRSTFKRMIYTDLEKSLRSKKDIEYIMRDFRVDPFRHPCHARHTFDGQRFESIIDGYKLKLGGFISNMPGYIISQGKFYPGVYQTIISPAFLVFFDRTGITKKLVKKFENILCREVRHTRKKSPSATYAKAHNRYDIFPPGRYDDGHDSYVSPKQMKKYVSLPSFNITGIELTLSPKVAQSYKSRDSKDNQQMRNEIRNYLTNWKKEILKNAEIEIEKLIEQKNFETLMIFAKQKENHWYTVTTVHRIKQLVKQVPSPYKKSNSLNSVIHKEVFTQLITPSDIMRLNAYEKLAQISGKVYIACVMDPADKYKNSPISYAVVIPMP